MDTAPVLLYVEDDLSSIKVMRMLVEKVMKLPLHVFQGSDRFMEKLKALDQAPDLFLLDIHMSPHDGFELLWMLRSNRQYRNKKVIAVTASVMGDEIELLKKSGFDGAISKPLNISIFPGLIKSILDNESVWFIA